MTGYLAVKNKVDNVVKLIEETGGSIVDIYQKPGEPGSEAFICGIQFTIRPDPVSQNYHE